MKKHLTLYMAIAALACGKPKPLSVADETRQITPPALPAHFTDGDRFGADQFPGAPGGVDAANSASAVPADHPSIPATSGSPAETAPAAFALTYKLPAGWTQIAPTQFRQYNFTLGPAAEGQCYISIMPGDGGGLLENLNRWRKQMGQPPVTQSDLADAPSIKLLGQQALYVESSGDYTGMMGTGAMKEALMLGALAQVAGQSVFVKLIAPAKLGAAQRTPFKQFVESLTLDKSVSPTPDAHAGHNHSTTDTAPMINVGGPPSQFTMPPGSSGADRITYTTPAGWTPQTGQSMRAASFMVGSGANACDCSVFLMPEAAGGLLANINRWRNQMELGPLDEAAINNLPTTEIAGTQGKLVELEGRFTGMNGTPQAASGLIGVVCELGSETLFVKLTGPRQAVSAARGAVIDFCRSLKLKS